MPPLASDAEGAAANALRDCNATGSWSESDDGFFAQRCPGCRRLLPTHLASLGGPNRHLALPVWINLDDEGWLDTYGS